MSRYSRISKAVILISVIIDTDTDTNSRPYDRAVLEGFQYDIELGSRGWPCLFAQEADEDAVNALAYTSGMTSRLKGIEYTHHGCCLARGT